MSFGGSGIEECVFEKIKTLVKPGSHILELGSGASSTGNLGNIYSMCSIEDNKEFLDLFKSKYYYVPAEKDGWYQIDRLKEALKCIGKYDLLLIDGPGSRITIIKHLDLFKWDVPCVIHDTNRPLEKRIAETVAKEYSMNVEYFNGDFPEAYAVLTPKVK